MDYQAAADAASDALKGTPGSAFLGLRELLHAVVEKKKTTLNRKVLVQTVARCVSHSESPPEGLRKRQASRELKTA